MSDKDEIRRRFDVKNRRIALLKRQLREYGRCKNTCATWHSLPGSDRACTCGFEQALEGGV